jgi:serine/threonine protein kinase
MDMANRPFDEAQKQAVLKEVCEVCHKPINNSRKGSLTGWAFGESRCECKAKKEPHEVAPASGKEMANRPPSEASTKRALDDKANAPDFGDRYELLGVIGSGGMATVYKVRDKAKGEIFAAKVLNKDLAADEVKVKRFIQEAKAVNALQHPNIAQVYSQGECADKRPYLIMEYVDGMSLADVLAVDFSLDVDRALDIFIQACNGLEYAHSQGLIHRDLKPSNIVIERREDGAGVVKLVDFGIAKVVSSETRETTNLTESGDIFGSPPYMSPEQCLGYLCDARSDIYSLGCVMYEVLTGRPPFVEGNPVKTIVEHLNATPKRLVSTPWRRFPKALDGLLLRALSKDPDDRYQSAEELRKDLRLIKDGKKPKGMLHRRKVSLGMLVLPCVAALNLFVILGIIQQYKASVEAPIQANAIIAKASEIQKVFYDASIALGGYSITKSPLFSDRFEKIKGDIPARIAELRQLEVSAGDSKAEQKDLDELDQITQTGLQLLSEAKTSIDENQVDVAQFHTRHMYKEIRALSDSIQERIKALTAAHNPTVNDKNWLTSPRTIVLIEMLTLVLFNSILIWFVVSQTEASQRGTWRTKSSKEKE